MDNLFKEIEIYWTNIQDTAMFVFWERANSPTKVDRFGYNPAIYIFNVVHFDVILLKTCPNFCYTDN